MSSEDELSPDETDLEVIQETEAELEERNVQPRENTADTENGANDGAPAGDGAPADDTSKKVKKVRNPQPKLNYERVSGPRGLTVLEDIFKEVKFKGSKHEEADLNLLMRTYEYWAHRLMPQYTFDHCLERLEKLGSTKPVVTLIKRIRQNMLLDDLPVIDNDDDNENDHNPSNNPIALGTAPTVPDEFDNLLSPLPLLVQTPSGAIDSDSGELTEEQLNRIHLNRQKAQQRRKEMLLDNSQVTQDHSFVQDNKSNENQNNRPSSITKDFNPIEFNENEQSQFSRDQERSLNLQLNCDEIALNGSFSFQSAGTPIDSQNGALPTSSSSQNDMCISQVSVNTNENHTETTFVSTSTETSQSDVIMNDAMSSGHSESQKLIEDVTDEFCLRRTISANHDKMVVEHSDDIMSVTYDTPSQESQINPLLMSYDSEKYIRSSQDMIVSDIDSPMEFDSA